MEEKRKIENPLLQNFKFKYKSLKFLKKNFTNFKKNI